MAKFTRNRGRPGATRGAPHRGGPGLIRDQRGPFANAYPYTSQTEGTLRRLAALNPKMLAIMHGSTFVGDGGQAISDLARVLREVLSGDIATE